MGRLVVSRARLQARGGTTAGSGGTTRDTLFAKRGIRAGIWRLGVDALGVAHIARHVARLAVLAVARVVPCRAVVAMNAMPPMLSQHEAWRADGPAIASCIHGRNSNAQANAQ